MKCENCGFENKDTAKFCTKCGAVLNPPKKPEKETNAANSNTKYIIIALIIVIVVLVGCIGYFAGTINNNGSSAGDVSNQSASSSQESSGSTSESQPSTSESTSSASESTSSSNSKSWESIGSYSGSGSGTQTVKVPSGQIMVKLSAYPIKNYATNHLYVSGPDGQHGGVDWGSYSDVETRSDSFSYTSSSSQTFTIDYYETVSWEVEFYRYQ